MRCFFYGSLMDVEVLELVIARRLPERSRRAGALPGFARRAVAGETFPALCRDPAARVAGVTVNGLTDKDLRRITYFEGEEFVLQPHTIEYGDGRRASAWVFVPTHSLQLLDEPWELASWQARHKARFMELARRWMAGYGSAGFAEQQDWWMAMQSAASQREE